MTAHSPLPHKDVLRSTALKMTLRGCQLFQGLSEPDLDVIASLLRLRSLDKDEYLFREGEPAEGFYVMQRGTVNVHRVNAAGKEQVIHVFRPPESLGEAALASHTGYPANARAVEASSVLIVPKVEFLGLVSQRPDLAMRMLGSMSQHLRVLVSMLDDLTLKDVETRLANWLVKRCPQPPASASTVIRLSVTKRVLAAELGTTAETLSRTLAQFRDLGLINVKGAVFTIANPARLDAWLQRLLSD